MEVDQDPLPESEQGGGAAAGRAEEQRQRVADERQTERKARERERQQLRGRAKNLVQDSHKIHQPPTSAEGVARSGDAGAAGNAPTKQDPGRQLEQQ